MRTLGIGILILLGLAPAGCSPRYTIEPGLWELTFLYRKDDDEKFHKTGPMRVEVVSDFNYSEEERKKIETVEVWLKEDFDPDKEEVEREEIGPLSGLIKPATDSKYPRIDLIGQDHWHFKMWADVQSREKVKGLLFGRPTVYHDSKYVEGRWEMKKIPDDT